VVGVAIDSAGNLVAAVTQPQDRVRVVPASGGTFYGVPMTAGNLYTAAGNGQRSLSGNNYRAINAEFESPGGIAVDPAGDMAIFDYAEVRLIPAAPATMFGRAMLAGHVYDIAGTGHAGISGDGGLATSSQLWGLFGGAFDPAGNLVVADEAGSRLRLVAAATGTFYGQAMTAGHIYTVAGTGTRGFSGDGGPATAARLSIPAGLAVDGHGNLVFADNSRIRVVAAATGTFYGQAMTAGNIYTIAGTGTFSFSGDGGPAIAAALSEAVGVALDGTGNVIISDTYNNRIRVIAESDGTFYGQAMTAGDIYTVAGTGARESSGNGGPATAADLLLPWGITVDPAGNLIFGDGLDSQARLVAATSGTSYGLSLTAGDIYAVAGTGQAGFTGDTHEAARARLSTPSDVAIVPAGDLVIADTGNHRVRVVSG
jgi:trimeric autotransporter adhesin